VDIPVSVDVIELIIQFCQNGLIEGI